MEDIMGLQGSRVIVLGGSSGFGLATAQQAASAGAQVTIVSRSQARLDAALTKLPPGSAAHAVDLADAAAARDFFGTVEPFDHLVFTAGDSLHLVRFETLDLGDAHRMFDVRFWGLVNATRFAAPRIRAGGSITLTNGIVGQRAWKGWAIAAAISGAIESLTRGLAVELAPLRVNTVCAGVVRTPLWDGMEDGERQDFYAAQAKALPLGRIGEADDIAAAYLFAMQNDYATGQIFTLDGGALLV
jgi:NAD(P)-dependent dehydrogenase (short-subunit alcohol dehydrogenase family)